MLIYGAQGGSRHEPGPETQGKVRGEEQPGRERQTGTGGSAQEVRVTMTTAHNK